MKRSTLILVIVLVVVLAGAGVYWYFNRDTVSQILNPSNSNSVVNTNVEVNTNTAPVNASLNNELKGDTELDQTVTLGDTSLHFSSVSTYQTYEGEQAEDGQQFVVVFFDAVSSDHVLAANQALADAGVVLRYTGGTSELATYKVAGDAVQNDRGYLKFLAPTDLTQPEVMMVTTNTRFSLPI